MPRKRSSKALEAGEATEEPPVVATAAVLEQPAAQKTKKPRSRRSPAQIKAVADAAAKQDYATQHTGVYWGRRERTWLAQGPADATNGKKQTHLGRFDTDEAAAKAYDMYVEVHRPELPLNFPREGQPAAHGRS